jgi:hypothetical protein
MQVLPQMLESILECDQGRLFEKVGELGRRRHIKDGPRYEAEMVVSVVAAAEWRWNWEEAEKW